MAKILDIGAFAVQIRHFGLENAQIAIWFAHYVPFLEVTCALALLARRYAVGATVLCMVLLVGFEGGLTYGWMHGYKGGCGCFGKFFGGTTVRMALLRNAGLLVLAAGLLVHEATRPGAVAGGGPQNQTI